MSESKRERISTLARCRVWHNCARVAHRQIFRLGRNIIDKSTMSTNLRFDLAQKLPTTVNRMQCPIFSTSSSLINISFLFFPRFFSGSLIRLGAIYCPLSAVHRFRLQSQRPSPNFLFPHPRVWDAVRTSFVIRNKYSELRVVHRPKTEDGPKS